MNIKLLISGIFVLLGGFILGTFFDKGDAVSDDITVRTKYEAEQDNQTAQIDTDKHYVRGTDPKIRVTSTETATIELFKESAPSVVFISTSKVRRDYWSRNIMEIPAGTGSGFIWDEHGHIVTNYHVIKGASKITVTLADQSTYDATLVGTEADKDLAVLKINAPSDKVRPIKVGASSELIVGQSVYAIGNPFGLDQSLTKGIISALGREIKSITGTPIKEVIQTDAAINPGNSGGPLLDSSGRLIGVNTMIYSPSGASAGIGFSIPVDEVNYTVTDLLNNEKRPIIGITLVPMQYTKGMDISGAMIMTVGENSPAERAQLRPTQRNSSGQIIWGDIIVGIDNHNINSNNDLLDVMKNYKPGDEVLTTVKRNGKKYSIKVVLASA